METSKHPKDEERTDEATSSDTVADIADAESGSLAQANPDPGPSPDGTVDEPDELEKADPV